MAKKRKGRHADGNGPRRPDRGDSSHPPPRFRLDEHLHPLAHRGWPVVGPYLAVHLRELARALRELQSNLEEVPEPLAQQTAQCVTELEGLRTAIVDSELSPVEEAITGFMERSTWQSLESLRLAITVVSPFCLEAQQPGRLELPKPPSNKVRHQLAMVAWVWMSLVSGCCLGKALWPREPFDSAIKNGGQELLLTVAVFFNAFNDYIERKGGRRVVSQQDEQVLQLILSGEQTW